jgi:23S rRNA (pseudouridine1915-N3)-methyltransferase
MKVRILAVGRKGAGWVADAENDYLKRLRPFAEISCERVAPEDEHSLGDKSCSERESSKLLGKCRPDDYIIACDHRGKSYNSKQLAGVLRNLQDKSAKICFVIGGSHGLSEAMLQSANLAVSFSPLTFPHELFRVMLLEQIYRAFTIIAGKKYHK